MICSKCLSLETIHNREALKMRKKLTQQLTIFQAMAKNDIAKELQQMSEILDANPSILDPVYNDLTRESRSDTGREGMTAEQVLRAALLKQYRHLTYEELAFHLEDSRAFRSFARLNMGQYPCASVLQDNIKSLGESSWESIHNIIVNYACAQKLEKGRKVRIDASVVETNIHRPTDSSLLYDGVRVITRLLNQGHGLTPCPEYSFSDHTRVMKKRWNTIRNARKEKKRVSAYRDMLTYAGRVCQYGEEAIPVLSSFIGATAADTLKARGIEARLKKALELLYRVIDQTDRRIFKGEKVPSDQKIISFFEPHSDIIVKKYRETEYGHKVFFTGGSSSLILDCVIEQGNPADSTKFMHMLERQEDIFGRMPRQVSADGGFASKDNLKVAREAGVKDVAFSKKRGLAVLDMAKSNWVYKQLRNFRAGIEANISTLKRAFGLDRCNWTGWKGFKQYVWSSIVSYNLLVLARLKLKAA